MIPWKRTIFVLGNMNLHIRSPGAVVDPGGGAGGTGPYLWPPKVIKTKILFNKKRKTGLNPDKKDQKRGGGVSVE